MRVFIEPLAYYFVAQSGKIASVEVDLQQKTISVQMQPPTATLASANEGIAGDYSASLFTHFHLQVCSCRTLKFPEFVVSFSSNLKERSKIYSK